MCQSMQFKVFCKIFLKCENKRPFYDRRNTLSVTLPMSGLFYKEVKCIYAFCQQVSANCWDVWDSVKTFPIPTKHPPVVRLRTRMVAAIKGSDWRL
jgi:hypothetical protein